MFLGLREDEALYFLHIPKTAGMTLSNLLDDFFGEDEIFPTHYLPDLSLHSELLHSVDDAQYRLYRGHFNQYLFDVVTKPLSVITFLRDPIERTLSNIRYGLQLVEDGEAVHWLKQSAMTFEDFMSTPELHRFQANLQFACLAGDLKWLETQLVPLGLTAPQTLIDDVVWLAQKRLRSYRVVGIQERFDDSLMLLAYELGFPLPKEYTNENTSSKKTKTSELSPEFLATLRDMNQIDVQLYETAVEVFEQRFQAMCDHLNSLYPEHAGHLPTQLEAYYQQRLLESAGDRWRWTFPSDETSLHYTFDQPLLGTGWHRRNVLVEEDSKRFIRWTGPEHQSTLALALPTLQPLQVSIQVVDSVNAAARDSLCLAVNGVDIPLSMELKGAASVFRGVIPYTALAEAGTPQQLTLTTLTSPLSEKYPGDRRLAGVAIESIDFTPLAEAGALDETITLDFSGEMFGPNWHAAEAYGDWPIRWTGGEMAALPLRIDAGQKYQVKLETLSFPTIEALKSFHLRVNETDIPLQMNHSQQRQHVLEFTGKIPQTALLPNPNYQNFQFIVDEPAAIMGQDGVVQRILGVCLMSMTLVPADSK